jgi:hypothetical protein
LSFGSCAAATTANRNRTATPWKTMRVFKMTSLMCALAAGDERVRPGFTRLGSIRPSKRHARCRRKYNFEPPC